MKLYSTREAAAYLGISYDSMKQRVRQGKVTPDGRIGTGDFFRKRTLDASHIAPKLHRGDVTLEKRREIARRWWAGETQRALGREFNLAGSTIYYLAKLHAPEGADKRQRKGTNWITPELKEEIRKRLEAGETATALGRELGIDDSWITRIGKQAA